MGERPNEQSGCGISLLSQYPGLSMGLSIQIIMYRENRDFHIEYSSSVSEACLHEISGSKLKFTAKFCCCSSSRVGLKIDSMLLFIVVRLYDSYTLQSMHVHAVGGSSHGPALIRPIVFVARAGTASIDLPQQCIISYRYCTVKERGA